MLVGLFPYWNYTNIGIFPVLDDRYFWFFWKQSFDFVKLVWNFLNFLYVNQFVCWLTSLLKGPSFGNLKDQRGMQDKPPGPVGCSNSPLATSPIISSAFALWPMQSSTSWSFHLLTYLLTNSLPFSKRKLEKSVNIDARTLKFCMNHPWTQSLRFRENQIVCMSLSLLVGLLPYWN